MRVPAESILTVDGLMAAAFNRPREPRSDAYKQGVRAGLTRIIKRTTQPLPFKAGTAESDAFFAGEDEARLIVSRAREQEQVA